MAGKKFDRDQVAQALRSAGISSEKSAEVLGELSGETPAPRRTRGSGAPIDRKSSFTL